MKTFLLIIITTSVSLLNAQIVFEKTYGENGSDEGRHVQQTSDGGYITDSLHNE